MNASVILDYLISNSNGDTLHYSSECSLELIREAILRGFQIKYFEDPVTSDDKDGAVLHGLGCYGYGGGMSTGSGWVGWGGGDGDGSESHLRGITPESNFGFGISSGTFLPHSLRVELLEYRMDLGPVIFKRFFGFHFVTTEYFLSPSEHFDSREFYLS